MPPPPWCTERYTRSQLDSNLHDLTALAIPGGFLPIQRLDTPARHEWMATLPDGTEVVVADMEGKPNRRGIEKAIATVQSRACLEARARQLLVPLGKENGEWRLVAIDFGLDAQRHDCEFLMCFAFQATQCDLADTSPYVEVGFALPARLTVSAGYSPMFILTIQMTTGI